MGSINNFKIKADNKVEFNVIIDYQESLKLKGNIHNIHLFSEDVESRETSISTRGKKGNTKYLFIPKEFRDGIEPNAKTQCQRLETKERILLFYMIDKF